MAAEAATSGLMDPGWLSGLFKTAVKTVTIGVAAAVAWQVFLDPLFFPLLHDPTNLMGQAWMAKMQDWFGWIPQMTGLTKDPGLLTPFMEDFLSDKLTQIRHTEEILNTGANLSLDSL